MNPDLEPGALAKPIKGTSLLGSRDRRQSRVASEQSIMRACRKHGKCIVPNCEYRTRKLPIDACHVIHRGIGGDPKGTRTTPNKLFPACRIHHGMHDRGELEVKPLNKQLDYRLPCKLSLVAADGTKTFIGISEARVA